ncbi:hypothetical protein ACFCX0_03830 [Streptomyces sp. NPDC056352]|uniref:hypothetical protein n=1 Tax=Streptomyces sp. NPDC056352 TaxID=3345791 RepID=UPI0035DF0814
MTTAELTREERTARLADLRAREAARKVVLGGVPLMDLPLHRRIAFAVYDPGAIIPRGDNYREPVHHWQARAIAYVLPELAELDRLRAELAALPAPVVETAFRDGLGNVWPTGHFPAETEALVLKTTPTIQRTVRTSEWTEVTS